MTDKPPARIILNARAVSREDIRKSIERMRRRGYDVSVRIPWDADDVVRYVSEAADDARKGNVRTLISGGGDGTLNEIVAAAFDAAGEDAADLLTFGVLPLGTANDFAKGIGLDANNMDECLAIAMSALPKSMDLGRVNGRAFVNMATGGFGSRVTSETDPALKSLLGAASYLFTGLQRFGQLSASTGRLISDDLTWEGDFFGLAVGNGRQAGGGMQLCPNAELDDGLLDVTVIPAPKGEDAMPILRGLVENGLRSLQGQIMTAKVPWLVLETEQPIQLNLDGEPLHGNRMDFQVLPHAIRFRGV